jgi:PAS domain S-box-containing protein
MDRRSHGTSKLGLWFPAALILTIGIAGSLAAFWLIRQGEYAAAVERFALRADWRTADLENKINSDVLPIAGIAAHLATVDPLTPAGFASAVTARYAYAPERRPLVVSWVARVPGEERARFEASVRAAGIPDFAIRNIVTEGGQERFVPAPARDVYYPVHLGMGFEGVPRPLGVDFAADGARRAAIERALDSGEPRSLIFVPRERAAPLADLGISMYVPVYAGGGIPATAPERRARARGVIGGTFLVERILGRAIDDTPAMLERLLVYADPPSASGARAFAEFAPGAGEFRVRRESVDLAALPGLRLDRAIDVVGTPWYLVFNFAPELITAQRSWAPWTWLAFGLIATALLALAMFLARRRTEVMALLASRTAADLAERDRGLRQANSQIAAIVAASPVAIVSLDGAGRVTSWNPAAERITGYEASETVGNVPPVLEAPEASAQAGSGGTLAKGKHRDGSEIELLMSSAPIVGDGGEAGRIVVAVDVTDRNRLDRQLHQLQKMETIGQLTGGLAHDFNNLLGIIIGNLDLLAERLANDREGSELAQAALSAGLRGADLNRALLAFSRRQPLQPRTVDVNEAVRGMSALLRRTLGEQIEVRLQQAHDLANALVDPAQLEAALLNLSVNARDAMPKGGALTIETANAHLDESYVAANADALAGDYVCVSVTDTGTGMAPEVVARAFEPFFTTKDVGKGTGLGLSMVYGFIKQSGGHAKIYSELGHGTTVRLYLPRAAAASARLDGAAVAREAVPSGRETILVVEDNEQLRAVAVRLLDELGYRIREVRNGHEALALLRATPDKVDLLFSDIVMPGGLDGRTLASEAVKLRPGLKVLLTSGFTEASGIAEGVLGAAVSFVAKPYRRHELARRVRQVLDNE